MTVRGTELSLLTEMVYVNRESAARVLGTVEATLHLFPAAFCQVSDLLKV
jgi:hypothetical protein